MSSKHEAAVLTAVGSPLVVVQRDTPEPGPDELLIETKALAVNPVDYYMRDRGVPPAPILPAVLGEDVAGMVVKHGPGLNPAEVPAIGSRVLALASSFYHNGNPDYGAFQKYTIARREGVIDLPETMSFEEGAICPLAVLTALSAYTTLGIPIDTKFTGNEAILIWGGSSSVGSFAVQSAKCLGYTVYATAGAKNLEYVTSLGADAAFDYKSPAVVEDIVAKAKADGVSLLTAHTIVDNALQQTLDVLRETKGDKPAKVAHAPLIPEGAPTLDNTEIKFTYPPIDPVEKNKHIQQCFAWLKEGFASGKVVPSPRAQIIPGGIGGVNDAFDVLKAGVSGSKLVVSC